jgi:hypothetical protein
LLPLGSQQKKRLITHKNPALQAHWVQQRDRAAAEQASQSVSFPVSISEEVALRMMSVWRATKRRVQAQLEEAEERLAALGTCYPVLQQLSDQQLWESTPVSAPCVQQLLESHKALMAMMVLQLPP